MSRYISKYYGIDEDDYIGMYNRVRKGGFWFGEKWIEVKTLPTGFWNKQVAKELIRYYVLDIEKITRKQYLKKASRQFFIDGGLRSALKSFGESIYKLSAYCFPEREINPWELSVCPTNYLNSKKHCKRIMQWICVQECIHRDRRKFCKKMSIGLFEKYGLIKVVKKMGGIYNYVNYVYPGKYKPWELNMYRITDELALEAIKWMIEEKLQWTKEDVCKNICANTFRNNGLESILSHRFDNSPIKALNFAYPGEYTQDMLEKWCRIQKKTTQ